MRNWLVRHAPVRAAAVGWWLVMLSFTALFLATLSGAIFAPGPGRGTSLIIAAVLAPPLAREWRHVGEMRRMVLHPLGP
jgi:hypothetical protein